MIEDHIDLGLLDFLGIEEHYHNFGENNENRVLHFNLDENNSAVILENKRYSNKRRRFQYYVGLINEMMREDEDVEHLNLLNKKIEAVKNPSNKKKARSLQDFLLASLYFTGYRKGIENYYKRFIDFIPKS